MPDPTDPPVRTHRVEASIHDVIRDVGAYAEHIVIGDGNHADQGLHDFLHGKELMKSFAEAGVHHVCLEVHKDMQSLADRYADGEMSEEDFVKEYTSVRYGRYLKNDGEVDLKESAQGIANTIKCAKQYGMKAHFVDTSDDQRSLDDIPEYKKALTKATAKYTGASRGEIKEALGSVKDYEDLLKDARRNGDISDDEKLAFEGVASEAAFAGRARGHHDDEIYSNIKNATNGEKTAVIYGSAHNRLIELMKNDGEDGNPVLNIDTYNSEQQYSKMKQPIEDLAAQGIKDRGEPLDKMDAGSPDMIYVFDSDQTYVTDKASEHLLQNIEKTRIDESRIAVPVEPLEMAGPILQEGQLPSADMSDVKLPTPDSNGP